MCGCRLSRTPLCRYATPIRPPPQRTVTATTTPPCTPEASPSEPQSPNCVVLSPSLETWIRFSSSFLSISPYKLHPAAHLDARAERAPFSHLFCIFSALGTRIHNKTVLFSPVHSSVLCGLTLDPRPSTLLDSHEPSRGTSTRRARPLIPVSSSLFLPPPRHTVWCSPYRQRIASSTCRSSHGAPAAREGWP